MMRDSEERNAPRNWSGASTLILLTFVVIGILEAGAHQVPGAVVCFVLAVCYPPLRVLRGRLTSRRDRH
jgi:hypothetical protein